MTKCMTPKSAFQEGVVAYCVNESAPLSAAVLIVQTISQKTQSKDKLKSKDHRKYNDLESNTSKVSIRRNIAPC